MLSTLTSLPRYAKTLLLLIVDGLLAAVALWAATLARVGGIPDVVSSREAVLIAPEDPAALAAAIRGVYADSKAAAARARRARQRLANEFALAPWLATYERIYRNVR